MCNWFRITCAALAFAFVLVPTTLAQEQNDEVQIVRGEVLDVQKKEVQGEPPSALQEFLGSGPSDMKAGEKQTMTQYTVRLQSGDFQGETVQIRQEETIDHLSIRPQVGDPVSVYIDMSNQEPSFALQDYNHLPGLLWYGILVVLLIFILARFQGLRGLLALVISLSILFYLVVPAIIQGYSPMLMILLGVSVVALFNISFILGFNKKSLIAILGTMVGVLVSTGAMYLLSFMAHLNVTNSENLRRLIIMSPDLSFQEILYAGIILGSIGAVIDVSVSVTSAVQELWSHNKHLDFSQLFASGMRVGRDIISAMIDTLVYAYTGSAFALILLFAATHPGGVLEILNYGYVANELARALIGATALLLTIPVTAFFAALFYGKKKKNLQK